MSPTKRSTPTKSTPTELTVRALVLQRQLYGSNVPYSTQELIPLDLGATTAVINARALKPVTRICLPEEADIVAMAMDVEAEAQHQLLLPVPHQSLQEPVQN
jgi:hypothetical protein